MLVMLGRSGGAGGGRLSHKGGPLYRQQRDGGASGTSWLSLGRVYKGGEGGRGGRAPGPATHRERQESRRQPRTVFPAENLKPVYIQQEAFVCCAGHLSPPPTPRRPTSHRTSVHDPHTSPQTRASSLLIRCCRPSSLFSFQNSYYIPLYLLSSLPLVTIIDLILRLHPGKKEKEN